MSFRKCSSCKISKSHTEFFKDRNKKTGIRYKCKMCCAQDTKTWRDKNRSHYNNYVAMWRAKNPDKQHTTEIKRHYNLSKAEYDKLLQQQHFCCAICTKPHQEKVKRGRLYVDHNHWTKKVRGLLCSQCNAMLGHAKDQQWILEKAIKYLQT